MRERRRTIPIIITLAILAPGLVAGTWVASIYSQKSHPHSAPPALVLPRDNHRYAASSLRA